MRINTLREFRFLLLLLCATLVASLHPSRLYPHGYKVDESLGKDQDISSLEIALSVPIAYYQFLHNSIYVNDNGLLSFTTEVPSFFNTIFPLSYPIIAPMYSSVDTRGHGSVYYRETKERDLLQRATADVNRYFSAGRNFRAQSLFIATWSEVGRFEQLSDLLNTAQVVIASNGNESYGFFLYPDNGIQWVQGQTSLNAIQDARTQAGFMSGSGQFYKLPGSGSEQVKNYPKMSNVNEPGMFAFRIGQTANGENIGLPDMDNGHSLEVEGVETCSNTKFPCLPSANCQEFYTGICCECQQGFFGNGRTCIPNEEHLRVNGKINGILNDIPLKDKDVYCYVESREGRVYAAINQVQDNLGFDLQTSLVGLGHIVGWLFAVKTNGAPNGFTLTGGQFNRSVNIMFPQSGQQAVINEQYFGLDPFNFLNFKADIHGALPTIPSDAPVTMDDFTLEFTRVQPGTLKARLEHSFTFGENSVPMPVVIDETITFDECPHRTVDPEQSTTRLKIERNHIQYDVEHQTTRYAFYDSKIAPLSENNPCSGVFCGPDSTCIVEGSRYRCVCNRGYQQMYHDDPNNHYNQPMCIDIDECRMREGVCHRYAECVNTPGSYQCKCIEGFVGDGHNCENAENECNNIQCSNNAECLITNRGPRCMCKNGFFGDGIHCEQIPTDVEDCRTLNLCDLNADCRLNRLIGRYTCVCNAGYRGDGIVCTEESESCENGKSCGMNAECISEESSNYAYYCACNQGYVGDGYTCVAEISADDCNVLNNCHRHAKCVMNTEQNYYECVCDPGFTGNGYKCYNSSYINTCNEGCSPNADCLFDPITRNNICRCRSGYVGNGLSCQQSNDCDPAGNSCDANSECQFNAATMKYECQCKFGFVRNELRCTEAENVDCNVFKNCDGNATCVIDPYSLRYYCQCNSGFEGNGKTCKRRLSCDQLNNCDVKARCVPDGDTYRCQCSEGFVGDGYQCKPRLSCREDRSVCNPNAECLYNDIHKDYVCQCHYGFIGDGYQCDPVPIHEGDYLIFSQGMSILRMPLSSENTAEQGYPLLIRDHQVPVGLDVDCLNGYVYWGDMIKGNIHKKAYNNTNTEAILEGISEAPEGLAVDWVSRNVYWTDSAKKSIEVSNLDGSLHKSLINTGLANPRGIAVHPGSGKLYWSDWYREAPKIECSNLDGKERMVLVTSDLKLPNNLAIDFDHNDLCWTDAGLHRIECMNLYTKIRNAVYSQASYPFDLTIAHNNIYWTDWDTKSVHVVDRNGGLGKKLEIPLGGHGKLFGIVTVPRNCPRISNACSVNNGGCKHLCLPNDRGRTCACPDINFDEEEACNEN